MTKPMRAVELASEQTLSAPEIPESANVCQREGKPELILVANVRQRKPAVFEVHAAAVPVISELRRPVLHLIEIDVESQIHCPAESAFVQGPVSEDSAKLIKSLCWRAGGSRVGCKDLSGHMQKRISSSNREWTEMLIEKHRAGVHSPHLEIVIRIPLEIIASTRGNAQS